MNRLLIKIPEVIGTQHLYLRCFRPGDEKWYLEMIQKNREHLGETDSFCELSGIETEEEVSILIRRFSLNWDSRDVMNIGVFIRGTDEFIGQFILEPVNWELPEFCFDFFWDIDHQTHSEKTEALQALVRTIFQYLSAERISVWCPADAPAKAAILQATGFKKEGCLRSNRRRSDGTLSSTDVFSVIRTEM